jgi:hypothetical protein
MKLEEEMNTMCQRIRDNVLKHERKVVPSGDPKLAEQTCRRVFTLLI